MIDLEKIIVLEELFEELEYEFGKKGDISVKDLLEFLDDRFDVGLKVLIENYEIKKEERSGNYVRRIKR